MPHVDGVNVLFVGHGKSAPCWYRCVLPAQAMGADWVAFAGEPPKIVYLTGLVGGNAIMPRFEEYDVVVVQQPRGPGWTKIIEGLQAQGVKVLFEIDDYVQAIRKMPDHDWQAFFPLKVLKKIEANMRAADGLIVATEWLADKYRTFNPNVWVCRNGIDLGRYRLTRPPRATVNVIWAGGTGHARAFEKWMLPLARVMRDRPHVNFIAIGQPFAEPLAKYFGARALSIPFTALETYPSAMTNGDIALAPAGSNLFFRGKSDLRFVEAGALGIPTIGDPRVYPAIEHGVNGMHATTPGEVEEALLTLVDNPTLRIGMGAAAQRYVTEHRTLRQTALDWLQAFAEVSTVAGPSSP